MLVYSFSLSSQEEEEGGVEIVKARLEYVRSCFKLRRYGFNYFHDSGRERDFN